MAIPAGMYMVRVNQPGYGPKIVTVLMSDMGPLKVGPFTDLRADPKRFYGSGPPTASTLLAGNYSASIPGTGYLIGDEYTDTNAPAKYVCTTAGSNSSSVWQQISGGANINFQIYNNANAYAVGTVLRVTTTATIGTITLTPGTYIVAVAIPANGTGNQVPQYPEPASGTIYAYMIALGVQLIQTCAGGSENNLYVNASSTF